MLPLGIPTLIIGQDPQLVAAAAAAYAHWSAEAPVSDPQLELRIEFGSSSSEGVCFDIAVEGSRLRLSGPGAEGKADVATGKAYAIVSPKLANDPAVLRDVTDTLLLFLLTRSGRAPVHASAIVIDDLAVVLAGPSGSGKSTLALAAANQGLRVLSDDMVFVQLSPSFTLWGFPRPIHVFPEDAPPGNHPARLRNSKVKAAIPIPRSALRAEKVALILLERGSELALRPVRPAEAIDALMNLEAGFDLLEQESSAAIEALSQRGPWKLTLSNDPLAAIDLLTSQFARQSRA